LDSEAIDKKTEFNDIFFNKILRKLADFLAKNIYNSNFNETQKNELIESKQIILELICYCFSAHNQKIKQWTIHHDLTITVLKLIEEKSKILIIWVLKFLKSLLLNSVYTKT